MNLANCRSFCQRPYPEQLLLQHLNLELTHLVAIRQLAQDFWTSSGLGSRQHAQMAILVSNAIWRCWSGIHTIWCYAPHDSSYPGHVEPRRLPRRGAGCLARRSGVVFITVRVRAQEEPGPLQEQDLGLSPPPGAGCGVRWGPGCAFFN